MSALRSTAMPIGFIIVDERGKVVDGDQLMAAIAQAGSRTGGWRAPASSRRSCPISASSVTSSGIGLALARTAVGDRYVLEHMREHGYNLGGEQSGHIILSDYCTTGDGLVAALQLLSIVKRRQRPVSEVCHRFEPVPQILRNVRFRNTRPLEEERVSRAIEDGRRKLGNDGRLVICLSGTEPVVRVMGEGDDRDLVEQIVDNVCEALSAVAA